MKQQSKLTSAQQQQQMEAALGAQETRQQAGQEFATAEELLRFDAAHTAVPPGLAERLKQSAADVPAPRRSWWHRVFGR